MCILPLTCCLLSVREGVFRADGRGSWVAVFSLCSYGLTVCSIRLLIVLKCCAASSRRAAEKSVVSAFSAWKLSIPSSSVTRQAAVPPLKHHLQMSDTPQKKRYWIMAHLLVSVKHRAQKNKMQAAAHEARNFSISTSIWIISHWFHHQHQTLGTMMQTNKR